MKNTVFTFWFLFLLFSPTVPACFPSAFTLYVERPECDFCVAINTTICMGYCPSWERNLIGYYHAQRFRSQQCVYDKVEYRTALLPGCPFNTKPSFTYLAALSCHCDSCRTSSSECTERAGSDRNPCTKPERPLHPHSDQRSYTILFK